MYEILQGALIKLTVQASCFWAAAEYSSAIFGPIFVRHHVSGGVPGGSLTNSSDFAGLQLVAWRPGRAMSLAERGLDVAAGGSGGAMKKNCSLLFNIEDVEVRVHQLSC